MIPVHMIYEHLPYVPAWRIKLVKCDDILISGVHRLYFKKGKKVIAQGYFS